MYTEYTRLVHHLVRIVCGNTDVGAPTAAIVREWVARWAPTSEFSHADVSIFHSRFLQM